MTPFPSPISLLAPASGVRDETISERLLFLELKGTLERRDASGFLRAKDAIERQTGGKVIVFSTNTEMRWEGVEIWSGYTLKQLITETANLIPAEFTYNRIQAKKVIQTIIFGAGDYRKRPIGAFFVAAGRFQNEYSMKVEEMLRISALSPFDEATLPIFIMGASERVYPANFYRKDEMISFDIPLRRDLRGEALSSTATDVVEVLSGASLSRAERILLGDGRLAIRKTAPLGQDGDKLWNEANFMRALSSEGASFFPQIYSIDRDDEKITVVMEDLEEEKGLQSMLNLFFTNFHGYGKLSIPSAIIWKTYLRVYKDLIGPFYNQKMSETPLDFVQKYHLDKATRRLREAKELAPCLSEMIDSPFIEVTNLDEKTKYLPGFETLRPFIEAIGETGILSPPYLSKQHGDLNVGNILIDPLDYVLYGEFREVKFVDPNYLPEGNDYMYDFAKLCHAFYGDWLVTWTMDTVYGYRPITVAGKDIPSFKEFFYEEEANPIPFMMTEELSHLFALWISSNDDFFGLEEGEAWKARLLFNIASILMGQPRFHIKGDGQETVARTFYIKALIGMNDVINKVMAGMFDDGAHPQVSPEARDAWRNLNDRLAQLSEFQGGRLVNRGTESAL